MSKISEDKIIFKNLLSDGCLVPFNDDYTKLFGNGLSFNEVYTKLFGNSVPPTSSVCETFLFSFVRQLFHPFHHH